MNFVVNKIQSGNLIKRDDVDEDNKIVSSVTREVENQEKSLQAKPSGDLGDKQKKNVDKQNEIVDLKSSKEESNYEDEKELSNEEIDDEEFEKIIQQKQLEKGGESARNLDDEGENTKNNSLFGNLKSKKRSTGSRSLPPQSKNNLGNLIVYGSILGMLGTLLI